MRDETDFWAEEWAKLLSMAAGALNAADAVMDAMRGDLGPEFKGKTSAEAAPEIHRRIERWSEERNRLVEYAREAQAQLEEVVAGA